MVLQQFASIGSGFRRTIADLSPTVSKNPFLYSRGYHGLLRQYYENELFTDAAMWNTYKARHRLPRSVQAMFNPTRRAVDAYPGLIYPGAWTEDGRPLPDGTPHALQFPDDIIESRPEFVTAGVQMLTWGNWNAKRLVYVREGAMVGTAFVEIVDDQDRRKVYPEVLPIELVSDVTLDASGNVKAYTLEYRAEDERGFQFDYKKEVDQESIKEYRDRQTTREDPNPYGFVPAVWVQHRSTRTIFGAPVIAGVIPKIESLLELANDVHKYVKKLQRQPVVFWSKQAPKPIAKAGPSDEQMLVSDVEAIPWLWSNDTDGRSENMLQPSDISGAGEEIDRLLTEIRADLPEITMDEIISKLPNASGPIIDRMLPSVRGRVSEAQANYDAGTVKIIQMGVAIAGWRLSTGSWGGRSDLTRQQAKFDGFDLESFAKGDLDVSLLPRPLIPTTETERLMALQLRKDVAGLSDNEVRRNLGYSDEEITQIDTELGKQTERESVAVF